MIYYTNRFKRIERLRIIVGYHYCNSSNYIYSIMSESLNNLNSIKKQLQLYSLSTTTIGLIGEDRYEELKLRLETYEQQVKSIINNKTIHSVMNDIEQPILPNKDNTEEYQVPSLNNLSIGEIRSRLTMLG